MIEVKFCGLTRACDVEAAMNAGAHYLGFVIDATSKRAIGVSAAASLAALAGDRARSVAVLVDPDDALLEAVGRDVLPDFVQLHGKENPARVHFARNFAGKGVIKAFGVARKEDLDAAHAFAGAADLFLFDAKPPEGEIQAGGHGRAYDWTILRDWAPKGSYFLAGGLNSENVGRALAQSGARRVDASSGLESAPGIKDATKMRDFMSVARAVEMA